MKGVLFDLGDTLVDVSTFIKTRGNEFDRECFKLLGYKFSEQQMERAIKKANELINIRYLGSPYKYKPHVFSMTLSSILKVKLTKKQASEFGKLFREELINGVRLYPHSLEVLKYLKDHRYKIGIVSNVDCYTANGILNRLSIKHLFDTIIISEDVGREKITTIPFKIALKKLGLHAKDTIMVGDRIDEDITAAANIGISTVLINNGSSKIRYTKKLKRPNFVIKNILELKTIISDLR